MLITNENIDSIDYESLSPEQKWQVDWHRKNQKCAQPLLNECLEGGK